MPPSSDLHQGHKPHSSFFSVDWLAQSSHSGPICTSRPSEVSWRGLTAPVWVPSRGEPPQNMAIDGAKTPDLRVRGTPVAGLNKEPDPLRAPRVRTAFTTAQISTLESAFKLHQYLGPQERKKLAKEMHLTEVQIKTWFQNRRMKHKRQLQDSQLSVPFSGPLYGPLAIHPPSPVLGSGLQLFYRGAPLPAAPAVLLPLGSFWGPCPVEQVLMASAWNPCSRQSQTHYLPEPGGQARLLAQASSRGSWGLCDLPETEGAF
ncbi:homeobox protein VENTX [Elephas maximus indicus]|uniref:homeobox protein VENTX n=1 Tax=Elephas maximus indicus TaxID=99487 RepID=UPI00211696AE|nr:homeobox protein VENTX [Elephas maximus indicus]